MKRARPVKTPDRRYTQLWRIVDGAVRATLHEHPEYVAGKIKHAVVRTSICKRVVGELWSYPGQINADPAEGGTVPGEARRLKVRDGKQSSVASKS